jgi:hypothetical protein
MSEPAQGTPSKVAWTRTLPAVPNSCFVSWGKKTKAPPPPAASIFALNLYRLMVESCLGAVRQH